VAKNLGASHSGQRTLRACGGMTTSGEGMLLRSRTVPRVWIGQDEKLRGGGRSAGKSKVAVV
jgi:hypothetical protein